MSFRSRPVLDRKHRPRWQDELRTQQLTVVAFAVAIALALGIFGAAAWNGYWESHYRPIASVGGDTFDRSDLTAREGILVAEGVARLGELQGQIAGGPRDQLLQQQIEAVQQQLSSVTADAVSSLVDDAVLSTRAGDMDISVSDDEVDAALAERFRLPERVWANLIRIDPLPDDAEPDAEPTDEQMAAAVEEAEAALARVEDGEDFGEVAADVSDDFSSQFAGSIGWFADDDVAYDEYFDALADADEGEIVGPIQTDRDVVLLQLVQRREAQDDGGLRDVLRDRGVDDATYRDFVRYQEVADRFRAYFEDEVVVSPTEQRRVAQIYIAAVTGTVVPQDRARHVLIQPDPDLGQDQASATDEQWEAARAEAEALVPQLANPEANWFALAEEHSADTGSAARGGDLGWYDPEASPFVAPFTDALAELEVGEVSDPVRTDFGWHIIQKTGERESPQAQVEDLVARLEANPNNFAELAAAQSDDPETAARGGELGWVARWQLTRAREEAVFALTEEAEISPPVDEGAGGTTIYLLIESAERRTIESDRRDEIRANGFERWLDEVVRAPVETWIDPQFAPSTATS
jgi:parvulin-like peptidyl-prolyl isomerase